MANKTINDLPAKSGALAGTELIEVDDGSSKKVTAQQIADLATSGSLGSDVTALSISAGVVDVDLSLGDYFTLALTANVTSLTFSNPPTSPRGRSISIRLKQDGTGSRTFAIPASFKAINGSDTAVQAAANAYTILSAATFDQGTRWEYAMKAGG
jgi:hypothetical protein